MPIFHYFFATIILNTGNVIEIFLAIIAWSLVIGAGVVGFVRTENKRILELTLKAMKSDIYLEINRQIEKLRGEIRDKV